MAVKTLGRGPAFCLDCMNFSTNEREWLQHLHSEWNQIIPCKSAQWHQSVAEEAGNPRAFLNEFEWIQKTFYSLVSMLLNTTSILQGIISRTPQKNAQAWLTMLYQFLLLSLFGIPFCKTWSFEISSMLFFQIHFVVSGGVGTQYPFYIFVCPCCRAHFPTKRTVQPWKVRKGI